MVAGSGLALIREGETSTGLWVASGLAFCPLCPGDVARSPAGSWARSLWFRYGMKTLAVLVHVPV